jgi:hypothetical protein
MNNEPSGCRADEIKWITGNQGQGSSRSIEHPEVVRIDDCDARHAVSKRSMPCREIDFVTCPDVSQWTEERVTMSCQGGVAFFPGEWRVRQMPDRDLQRFLVVSFRNHRRETDTANFETPDRNQGFTGANRNNARTFSFGTSTD